MINREPYFASDDGYVELYKQDCVEFMQLINNSVFDAIITDPPYFLSGTGITCKSGKMASVNKGSWDKKIDPYQMHEFNMRWLKECKRLLKPNGTIWISGTFHNIHSVGLALQCLDFKILNEITWQKISPPPNLSCRYFTHATETILWAAKSDRSKHTFNYKDMKTANGGKQMQSVWKLGAPLKSEKLFGKHPCQKPEKLLERMILASTNENDRILDPFAGSFTTGVVSKKLKRQCVGIELNEEYIKLAAERVK